MMAVWAKKSSSFLCTQHFLWKLNWQRERACEMHAILKFEEHINSRYLDWVSLMTSAYYDDDFETFLCVRLLLLWWTEGNFSSSPYFNHNITKKHTTEQHTFMHMTRRIFFFARKKEGKILWKFIFAAARLSPSCCVLCMVMYNIKILLFPNENKTFYFICT